jgi:hypothetical protein
MVRELWALDREPNRWLDSDKWHWMHSPDGSGHDGVIPKCIYDRLREWTFDSPDEARVVLARALCVWARG